MTADESGVYARGLGLAHYLVHDDFLGFVLKNPGDDQDFYDHFYATVLFLLNPSGNLDRYHLLNMLFALILFIAIFEVLLDQTQKPGWALLGPLFLFLTPRFSGDIPANPKDMPFAVLYSLGLIGIYFFRRHSSRSLVKALVLGLLFGLSQSSRMLGFTLYPVYIFFDLYFYKREKRHSAKEWSGHLLDLGVLLSVVFILSNFLMLVTWPYLGGNYLNHLPQLLSLATHFSWDNNVLFLGHQVPSTQLPWYYLPTWIFLTTPLFILFLAGTALVNSRKNSGNELSVLLTAALGMNLAFYFLFKPVLYDGLRHFLFLLPLMAILAVLGAVQLIPRVRWKLTSKIPLFLVGFNILLVGSHLVRLHPYAYVYFNELIGEVKGSQGLLDNDYWGASYKEAVEWLKANATKDERRIYKVTGSGNPYQIFCYFSPNMQWVELKDLKDADFYISYTRDGKDQLVDKSKIVHTVEREGVPLNYIFKLK